MKPTILSGGLAIAEILGASEDVREITTNVFPIYSDEAETPYIAYRRAETDSTCVKAGKPADAAMYTVICYADSYPQSVELAERVRAALDGYCGNVAGMCVRYSAMVDSREEQVGEAFAQILTFRIRI